MNKITNKDKVTLLSKKGMKELKKTIIQLENDRQIALRSLHELEKTLGRDERLSRIEKVSELEGIVFELDEMKQLLANSRLIPTKRTHLQVAIGSVVDLIDRHGRFFRFTIVDSVEADPSDGRISTLSPLGRNLIGRTVRDIVEWGNGYRVNYCQLLRIA